MVCYRQELEMWGIRASQLSLLLRERGRTPREKRPDQELLSAGRPERERWGVRQVEQNEISVILHQQFKAPIE